MRPRGVRGAGVGGEGRGGARCRRCLRPGRAAPCAGGARGGGRSPTRPWGRPGCGSRGDAAAFLLPAAVLRAEPGWDAGARGFVLQHPWDALEAARGQRPGCRHQPGAVRGRCGLAGRRVASGGRGVARRGEQRARRQRRGERGSLAEGHSSHERVPGWPLPWRGAADAPLPRGSLPLKGGSLTAASAPDLGGAVRAGTRPLSGPGCLGEQPPSPRPSSLPGQPAVPSHRVRGENAWVVSAPRVGTGRGFPRAAHGEAVASEGGHHVPVTLFPDCALLSRSLAVRRSWVVVGEQTACCSRAGWIRRVCRQLRGQGQQ